MAVVKLAEPCSGAELQWPMRAALSLKAPTREGVIIERNGAGYF
jgi:hypothetical protein